MAVIELSGVNHHYELIPCRKGHDSSRPVLMFIHGWLLSRHYWYPSIEYLSQDYDCLIYDLRGFGQSQPLPKTLTESRPFSLANYGKDVCLLLEKLEIDQAWLIGHSLGGSIALWGAKLGVDRVKGVICVNAGGGIYLKEEFERFRSVGEKLVRLRPQWLKYVPLLDILFARTMVHQPLARKWGKQRVLDFVQADTQAALGSLLDSTLESEVHLLPQITAQLPQPVYFIAGDKDQVMETKYVRHLASFHPLFHTPQGNVIEFPLCGHMAMVEFPQQLSQSLLDILKNYYPLELVDRDPTMARLSPLRLE